MNIKEWAIPKGFKPMSECTVGGLLSVLKGITSPLSEVRKNSRSPRFRYPSQKSLDNNISLTLDIWEVQMYNWRLENPDNDVPYNLFTKLLSDVKAQVKLSRKSRANLNDKQDERNKV